MEFLEDLDRTYETFEERLKRCNITLEELRKRFADFNKWYDGMIERIGQTPEQVAHEFYIDNDYWADHLTEVVERFNAWLLKK